MKPTALRLHVLENINRVVPFFGEQASARPRYQLDGTECTAQITDLMARKLIAKHSSGEFRRMSGNASRAANDRVGKRQPPSATALAAIRASLAAPTSVREIGAGRRQ